ncbi:2403_t:CDS:1, partial [Ambispora leptoticha]
KRDSLLSSSKENESFAPITKNIHCLNSKESTTILKRPQQNREKMLRSLLQDILDMRQRLRESDPTIVGVNEALETTLSLSHDYFQTKSRYKFLELETNDREYLCNLDPQLVEEICAEMTALDDYFCFHYERMIDNIMLSFIKEQGLNGFKKIFETLSKHSPQMAKQKERIYINWLETEGEHSEMESLTSDYEVSDLDDSEFALDSELELDSEFEFDSECELGSECECELDTECEIDSECDNSDWINDDIVITSKNRDVNIQSSSQLLPQNQRINILWLPLLIFGIFFRLITFIFVRDSKNIKDNYETEDIDKIIISNNIDEILQTIIDNFNNSHSNENNDNDSFQNKTSIIPTKTFLRSRTRKRIANRAPRSR